MNMLEGWLNLSQPHFAYTPQRRLCTNVETVI